MTQVQPGESDVEPASESRSETPAEPHYAPPAPGPKRTLRESFLHRLPHYPGPYNVGYMEIEMPAREPRAFSHIRRNHEPAMRMDTVLLSVYYPCELDTDDSEEWPDTVPWLARPRVDTCHGYAKFLSVPSMPVTAYIASTCMFTKLPAFRNAKLTERWAPLDPEAARQEEQAAGETGTDPQAEEDGDRPDFPVIVFSHGLGGSRNVCSSICGGLASYGVVVVALEHRDGSGARTIVNTPPGREGQRDKKGQHLETDPTNTQAEEKQESKRQRKKGKSGSSSDQSKPYYKVDYLFPQENPKDTMPNNPQGPDLELRGAQIEMRLAEIEEAYHVLTMINEGRGEEVRAQNLRKKGAVGSSSKGLRGIDWADWKGRLHTENVTIAGHSFGGATSVQALRFAERFPWIGQGVLLDPWGVAISPETTDQQIGKPVVSIGSEAFMHWRDNFDRVQDICREGQRQGALSWMMTIRGSTHLSQTDFAVLYPKWMSFLAKTVVNARRALFLNVASIFEFLAKILPAQQRRRFEAAWPNEHLLELPVADPYVSFDHRPDQKWIAARLKLHHEFSLRIKYLFVRERHWKERREARKAIPKPKSAPLGGLINWDTEVWMHMRPEGESSSDPEPDRVP